MNKHELDCVLKVHALSKSLTDEERKEACFVLYFGKWPRVLGVPPDSWKRLKPFRFLWYGGRDETAETLRHILSEGDMDASFSDYLRKKMVAFENIQDCYAWVKENSLE